MNKGQKDGEPSKTWPKLSLITEQHLKSIKIAIRRSNIPISSRVSPLRRKIESPETLKIHITGKPFRQLFEKDDITVNQGGHDICRGIKPRSVSRGRSNSPISDADRTPNIKTDCKHRSTGIFENNYNNCRPPFPLPPEEDDYSRKKEDETRYSSQRLESGEHSHRHSSYTKYDYESSKRMRSSRSPSFEHRKRKRRSPSPYPRSSRSYGKSERKYYHASPERRSRSPMRPGEYRPQKRRCSHSPLRPGEYRPRLNERSQSPLRPGEYRPRKRTPSSERRRSLERRSRSRSAHRISSSRERRRSRESRSPPLRPGEYRPPRRQNYEMPRHSSDYVFYEGAYTDLLRPPLMPRFMPPPHPRGMMRPGHILVPHVQYIPVPHIPNIRPQFMRPPKIYNNRVIPRLVTPPRTTSVTSTITSTTNLTATNTNNIEDNKAELDKE